MAEIYDQSTLSLIIIRNFHHHYSIRIYAFKNINDKLVSRSISNINQNKKNFTWHGTYENSSLEISSFQCSGRDSSHRMRKKEKNFTAEHIFPLDVRESKWKDVPQELCICVSLPVHCFSIQSKRSHSNECSADVKWRRNRRKKSTIKKVLSFIIKTCWWLKVVVTSIHVRFMINT